MRLPQLSVAFLVALALAVSTAVVLGGFGYVDYRQQRQRAQATLEAEHREGVERLAANLRHALDAHDAAHAETILRSTMRDENIAALSLIPGSPSASCSTI